MNFKNIVVISLTLLVVALAVMTAMRGRAYQGGQHGKIIENIAVQKPQMQEISQPQVQSVTAQKEDDKDELKAIKDKAGSNSELKVSAAYKGRCAACHGADGSGEQEGRKLMGPKLYGQSAEKIYKDLMDFKAGRKENVVMKGLLINTSEEELKQFADEIGKFASQK